MSTKKEIQGMTGNEAVAYAAKICDVDVVAAYPITPQTIMVERFSDFVANGEVKTEYVNVESEHSAMSACVGASISGARVFTATSSQGLALMHEILYIASGSRCPIVMGVSTRALSSPINIHNDHSDVMGSRDAGWIQIFVENPQEAYDTTIQAFKLAEDEDILTPVMVNIDGFITSHCVEGVETLTEEDVRKFLPSRKAKYKLDLKNPMAFGPLCLPDYYYEFRKQQDVAMSKVENKLNEVENEFEKVAGRKYGAIQTFGLEDAETAIVCMASTAGTARSVARNLRKEGKKVGVIKIRLYRPFPSGTVRNAVKKLKSLVVLDRAPSIGAPCAPLSLDVKAALYELESKPKVLDLVYGLGGRDTTPADVEKMFNEGLEIARTGIVNEPGRFVGVRE